MTSGPVSSELAFSSAARSFGTNVAVRVLMVLRSVVGARLLAPDEFGQFALALAVLGLIESTTTPGLHDAIIEHEEEMGDTRLQAIWTALVLRGLLLGGAIFVLAAPIAGILNNPEVGSLLRVLACVPFLRASVSLSPVLHQRDLDLRYLLRIRLFAQTVETLIGLGLAWYLRDAIALVIGLVVGTLASMIASHRLPGFKARLRSSFSAITALVRFARWRLLSNVLFYVSSQADDLIVGRTLGAPSLGLYNAAYRIANAPSTELVSATTPVVFPVLSSIRQGGAGDVRAAYRRYLVLVSGLAAGTAGLVGVTARPLVDAILGDAWLAMTELVMIMALGGYVRALLATGGALFLGCGKPELDTAMQAVRAAVLVISLAALLGPFGLIGAAVASVLSVVAVVPVWMRGLSSVGVSPGAAVATALKRLPAALLAMTGAFIAMRNSEDPWLSLLLAVPAGLAIWYLSVRFFDRSLYQELRGAARAATRSWRSS